MDEKNKISIEINRLADLEWGLYTRETINIIVSPEYENLHKNTKEEINKQLAKSFSSAATFKSPGNSRTGCEVLPEQEKLQKIADEVITNVIPSITSKFKHAVKVAKPLIERNSSRDNNISKRGLPRELVDLIFQYTNLTFNEEKETAKNENLDTSSQPNNNKSIESPKKMKLNQ